MIPALVVFAYLGVVLYIGIFAFRRYEQRDAEGYFLAGRSLGPAVFLLSLFGTTIVNADGREVPVRLIGEQHVMEDLGTIPSFAD